MRPLKIVLDTNALLRCISRRSVYATILDKLYENDFAAYVTNDILLEYEEKISDIFSSETAGLIIAGFLLLPNIIKVDTHFHLNLITADPDDNKFTDCAFAGNVHFLVTDYKHFNILKSVPFPSINVISLDQFKELLTEK